MGDHWETIGTVLKKNIIIIIIIIIIFLNVIFFKFVFNIFF